MHRLVTNEKRPGSLRWAVARRMHWWWGGHGDDECRHSASCELYALGGTYNHGWGFEIRLDGPYAETPIDAMVSAGRLVSIFASTSLGRGLCRALGVRDEHPRGVEFRISLGEGVFRWTNATVLWSLWTDPDHQVLTQWQRKNAGLSRWYQARCGYIYPIKWVLDRLWGKTTYTAEALETAEVTAHLEDGPYPLALTLERATWKRPRWPRPALVLTSVEYRVKKTDEGGRGYAESSYKYGGDGLVSAATRALTSFEAADPESWIPIAIASFTERVLKDRARNHPGPHLMPSPDRIAEILASERFLERLAEIEHERWAHWQRYVHENCERQADGSLVIPAELVDRWEAQIRTPYAQLSEREKEQNAADHRALPDIRDSIALLAHYRKALGL